jgi:ribosomal protein L23
MDSKGIIKYALISEKATSMIEPENKITFIVSMKADKKQIKEAVEEITRAKVSSVRTLIDRKLRKKAIVKFDKKVKAQDIAARVGLI